MIDSIPAIYDLYFKIVSEALSIFKKKLNNCFCNFTIEIFMLYLSIPSRINLQQLSLYSLLGEKCFRLQAEIWIEMSRT